VRNKYLATLAWLGPLVLLLSQFLWQMQRNYPLLGHDFFYMFPRLLEGKWLAMRQGLSIPWYSPHLCGGFPFYGNPNDLFYSLPQFLALRFDLWPSVLTTWIIMLSLGYWGWYRFGREVVRFSSTWAHTFALIVIANGFFLMHAVVGHLTFHTLPLLGWLFWLLFDFRTDTPRTRMLRAISFGLLCATMIFGGGFIGMLIAALGVIIGLPVVLLLGSVTTKQRYDVGLRILIGSGVAAACCASKLVAIWSLMRFFPRHLPFLQFTPGSSSLHFLWKAFFGLPQSSELYPINQYPFYIHEYDFFLSPVLLIGLAMALWALMHRLRRGNLIIPVFLTIYSLCLVFFFAHLARGYGTLDNLLQQLPIFSSMRVTTRFLYVPSILLTIVGVWGLSTISPRRAPTLALLASLCTVGAVFVAHRTSINAAELSLTLDYKGLLQNMRDMPDFLHKPVTHAEDLLAQHYSDLGHFFIGSTGVSCQESLIDSQHFPHTVRAAPVALAQSGSLNIYNPACFTYPEANNCQPGDRILVTDQANFEAFVLGQKTTWRRSIWQHIGDGLSVLSLCAAALYLGVQGIKSYRAHVVHR
jgi:hypothetical protein